MAATRKLQGEIDRCLKKVSEGVETFEDIWQKVHNATNSNQKEKYEADLKKEIKKLQRLRDQIKSWIASAEIKDKSTLLDYRKLIETQMERFKVVERETKTKAYSKEGLGAAQKMDPAQKEKEEISTWLVTSIDALNIQLDQFESEIESLLVGKKKRLDKEKQDRMDELKAKVDRHRHHIRKLETLLRMLDNMSVEVDQVLKLNSIHLCSKIRRIKDDVEYYIESSQEPDFEENEYIYDDIEGLDELELAGVVQSSATTDSNDTPNSLNSTSPHSPALNHNHPALADPVTSSSVEPAPSSEKKPKRDDVNAASKGMVKPTAVRALSTSTPPSLLAHLNHSAPPTSTVPSGGLAAVVKGVTQAPPQQPTQPQQTQAALFNRGPTPTLPPPSLSGVYSIPTTPTSKGSIAPPSTPGSNHHPLMSPPQSNFAAVASTPPVHSLSNAVPPSSQPSSQQSVAHKHLNSLSHHHILENGAAGAGSGVLQGAGVNNAASLPLSLQQTPHSNDLGGTGGNGRSSSSPPSSISSAPSPCPLPPTPPLPPSSLSHHQEPPTSLSSLKVIARDALDKAGLDSSSGTSPPLPPPLLSSGPEPPHHHHQQQQQQQQIEAYDKSLAPSEAHIPYMLGVVPLGPQPLLNHHRTQYVNVEQAYHRLPTPADSERLRHYITRTPCTTPNYYPQVPLPHSDTLDFFQRLSTESLFFIFYYMEGTKAQYLAAKALKKQSWRFHTKYMMWFQRHEEPKLINEDYEQGTYIYFDNEKWSQRKKEGFTFEYKYLEDRDLN